MKRILDHVARFAKNSLWTAIALSAAWHIFWISTIKVIERPADIAAAKFPKVFFLGPILSKGLIDVRVETRSQTFLERRFSKAVLSREDFGSRDVAALYEDERPAIADDGALSRLIEEALGKTKLKPEFGYKKTK
ncbi:MAG: hypothetical protein ABIJ27_06295 [Candidatus Omnitrophota bacterium]